MSTGLVGLGAPQPIASRAARPTSAGAKAGQLAALAASLSALPRTTGGTTTGGVLSLPGPSKKKGGAPSLWEQAGQIVRSLPMAAVGFARDIGESVAAPFRFGVEAATGNLPTSLAGYAERYAPAVTHMGEQFAGTGLSLAKLATGDVSDYQRAVEEGTILGKILGDVGNVAAVVAPIAGKIAGAAGTAGELAAAEAAAETGARVVPAAAEAGARVAAEAAPIAAETAGRGLAGMAARAGRPGLAQTIEQVGRRVSGTAEGIVSPMKPVNALLRKAGIPVPSEVVAKAVLGTPEARTALGEGVLRRFTPEGRKLAEATGEYQAQATAAFGEAVEPAALAQRLRVTEPEQAAAVVLTDQRFRDLMPLFDRVEVARRAGGDALAREQGVWDRTIERKYGYLPTDRAVTPEAVELAIRADRGKLPAEQLGRIRAQLEAFQKQGAIRTARVKPLLAPGQTGTELLEGPIERERLRLEAQRAPIQARLTRQADIARERGAPVMAPGEPMATASTRAAEAQAAAMPGLVGGEPVVPTRRGGESLLRAASRYEVGRAGTTLGRLRQVARGQRRTLTNLRSRAENLTEKMVNLRETANARIPNRVAAVNDPFVASAKRTAAAALKELPNDPAIAEGMRDLLGVDEAGKPVLDEAGNPVPGLIDETVAGLTDSGQRLAVLDRVHELFDEHNLPVDVRKKFDRAYDLANIKRDRILTAETDLQLDAMPAPYRPMAVSARSTFKSLMDEARAADREQGIGAGDGYRLIAEDLATSLPELVKQAKGQPTHMIGGPIRRPPGISTAVGTTPRKLAAEQKRTAGFGPTTARGVAQSEATEAVNYVGNQVFPEIEKMFGTPAREVLPDADWSGLHAKDAYDLAAAKGLVPLRGKEVNEFTQLVPKSVHKQLTAWERTPTDFEKIITRINSGIKTNLLAFSPRWHIGNIVGNIIMAGAYGGVNPLQLANEMRKIVKESGGLKELWEAGGVPKGTPARIRQHGLSGEQRALAFPIRRDSEGNIIGISEPRTPIGRTARLSYKANEFVDSMTRSAVYRARLRKGIPTDQAVREVLKAMGDYTRLNTFERRFMRQVVPFYPWLKHQTTAMMRLPLEHPGRAAFLAGLVQMYSDPSMTPAELEVMGVRVPLAGGFVNFQSLSPSPLGGEPAFMPSQIGQAISPLIKAPIGALTGLDIGKLGQYKRPRGTVNTGPYGEEPTPIVTDPGGLAYYLAGQLPLGRAARALVVDPSVARYQATGEQVGKGKGFPTGRTQLSTILNSLGIPYPEEVTKKRLAELRKMEG